MWGGGKASTIILLMVQLRNYLANGDVLADDVQAVLCEHNEAPLEPKKTLDLGRVFRLRLDQVLYIVLDADAALLIATVHPVIQNNRAVIVEGNLGRAKEDASRG
jgi:hypothetical protein